MRGSSSRFAETRVAAMLGGMADSLVKISVYQPAPGTQPDPKTVPEGREWIELVFAGRGAVRIAGAWATVGPGDLLWHQAGDQTIGRSDRDEPYRCLAVRLAVAAGARREVPRRSRWEDPGAAAAFAHEAVRLWVDGRLDRALLGEWVVSTLRLRAAIGRVGAPADLPTPLIRVVQRIELDYWKDLSVAQLASEAGWSTQHLHEACRRHLDASPHALLHRRRIQAARELLAASDLPLAEVAGRSGFSSPATLCRAFRAALGASPAAWRTRNR